MDLKTQGRDLYHGYRGDNLLSVGWLVSEVQNIHCGLSPHRGYFDFQSSSRTYADNNVNNNYNDNCTYTYNYNYNNYANYNYSKSR